MIYLTAKIFVYLLFALALGAAAGWLWRNQQAAGEESRVERVVAEPQVPKAKMEAALRARDQRLEDILRDLQCRDEDVEAHARLLAAREQTIDELERTCAELRERLEAAAAAQSVPPAAPAADSSEELAQVQRALAAEQRRVEELTQERELQRRSLQALEQQLEMAREDEARIANG